MFAYHVVTDRPMYVGQQIVFDEEHHRTFSINEVTANEQNPQAIGFYEHMSFAAYKRTDVDEQGRPYPLQYMKR